MKGMIKLKKKVNTNDQIAAEVMERVEELEMITYGHSQNAEEMTDQIMEVALASGVKDEKVKRTIVNEVFILLEKFRFECERMN